MRHRPMRFKSCLLGLLFAFTPFCLGTPARAQSMPAQSDKPVQQDNDTTRRELAQFDQFLDSHPEIAEQVRKDPSLVNSKNFLTTHAALQTYLQDHPAIR